MSRVSSLVTERVAALVAFFTTRPVAEVLDLVFLPVTLSLTYVPSMVAKVEVMAVSTAFHTLLMMPGFCFSSFLFSVSAAAVSSASASACCSASAMV